MAADKIRIQSLGIDFIKVNRRECFSFFVALQSSFNRAAQAFVILVGNQPQSPAVLQQLLAENEIELWDIIAVSH